jgi:hypothetical protein
MGKKEIEQESILRKYLSENYLKYEKNILRQEAIKKGYSTELFDRILNEISLGNTDNNQEELKNIKKQKDDFVLVPIKKQELEKALKGSNNVKNFFSPTQIMTYAFCLILLLVAGFGFANSFSLQSFSFEGGDGVGSSFEIGYPLKFISVSIENENPFEFNFLNFVIVFILYILVAYLIDLVLSNSFKAIKDSISKDNKQEKAGENLDNKEKEFKENPLNFKS